MRPFPSPPDDPAPAAPRPLLWVLPILTAATWGSALVVHAHLEALPLHLGLGLLTVWLVAFARRPRLSLLRLWLLLALIGGIAAGLATIRRTLDARWDRVRERYALLRAGVHAARDEVAADAVRRRARAGDPLALEALVERVRRGEDGIYADHAALVELGVIAADPRDFEHARPPELSVPSGLGLPPARPTDHWLAHDALSALRRAESWVAAVSPDFDAWHERVVRQLDAFVSREGRRPVFADGRWHAGGTEPGLWPGEVPYELLAVLSETEAASFYEAWLRDARRDPGRPFEEALLALEAGTPGRAVEPLRHARDAAERAQDYPELARAGFWMSIALRRSDDWQGSLGDVSRVDPTGWPSFASAGLELLPPRPGAPAFAQLDADDSPEAWARHVTGLRGVEAALARVAASTPRARARPERALLLEVAARIAARIDEREEMRGYLNELGRIRPRLAREVRYDLAGVTPRGLAAPVRWGAPRAWR